MCSCEDLFQSSTEAPNQPVKISKVVKAKHEGIQTSYSHQFSWWKGDFVLQPEIDNVYYLIFSDGTKQQVSIEEYATTNVFDTIVINK